MASARTEVIPVEPEVKYVLELSADEADILLTILGRFRAGGLTSDIFGPLAAQRGRCRSFNYDITLGPSAPSVGTLYAKELLTDCPPAC